MQDELLLTSDGSHTILSGRFGVSYHSRFGAVQESRHIFIDAALNYKAQSQKSLAVLEIGLGTGLNALLTLLESQKRGLQITYGAVEAYPISAEHARQLNFLDILQAPELETAFRQIHEGPFGESILIDLQFSFTKWKCLFEDFEPEPIYDIVYYDAFAPSTQPGLWEIPLLEKMYGALQPGGVLTTYCAKASVKRSLRTIGFAVEPLPGPPGKREMTRAIKL